ncbi:MAG: YeeE/YedE family protein [Burkholderiaceae bacterium]|nr:YeeE/YedE family protein [Burkholderiaceae bacterium]
MTIDWLHFTPVDAIAGGLLIGLAVAFLLFGLGRIAGISGIVSGLLQPKTGDTGWRAAFVVGLLAAPLVWRLFADLPESRLDAGWPLLIFAGLLVGFGTRLGSGCTSGHGVCGLSRLSPRSLVATLSFMGFGFVTVFVVRHLIG